MRGLLLLTLLASLGVPLASAGPVFGDPPTVQGYEGIAETVYNAVCADGKCDPPPCPVSAVCPDGL